MELAALPGSRVVVQLVEEVRVSMPAQELWSRDVILSLDKFTDQIGYSYNGRINA